MVHIPCTILATPTRTLHFNVVTTDDPLTIIIIPGIDKEVKKTKAIYSLCKFRYLGHCARKNTVSLYLLCLRSRLKVSCVVLVTVSF